MSIYLLRYRDESIPIPYEDKITIENEKHFDRTRLNGRYIALCKAVIERKSEFSGLRVAILSHGAYASCGSVLSRVGANVYYIVNDLEQSRVVSKNHSNASGANHRCILFDDIDQHEMFDSVLLFNSLLDRGLSDICDFIKMHLCINGSVYYCESNKEEAIKINEVLSFKNSEFISQKDHDGNESPIVVLRKFNKER